MRCARCLQQNEPAFSYCPHCGARLALGGAEPVAPDSAAPGSAAYQKLANELAAVLRISHALSSMTSLDDMVRETLEVSLSTLNAGAGAFYLYDEKQKRLVFSYVTNVENPEAGTVLIGKTLEPGQGVAGQVFVTGEPSIDADPQRHSGHLSEIGAGTGYHTRNMITLPLVSMQGKTIGVMQALNKQDGSFEQDDLELLTIMATHAATAIENARLYQEAKTVAIMHYLGDISHDIKNLMTPAQTAAQTLEMILADTFTDLDRAAAGDPETRVEQMAEACGMLREIYAEMIGMVVESANAVQERVREIADAVKGVIAQPLFEPASVAEIILGVAKTLSFVAERNGIALKTDGLRDIPPIMVDKKRLATAMYNLINNAIPETPAGGTITVRAHALPDGAFPHGAYLIIEVADTGKGMPEEVKQRLFTQNAISTKPGGTGLGTQIVKNAVDAHGGLITVESEQGKGTTFTVKLPFRTE